MSSGEEDNDDMWEEVEEEGGIDEDQSSPATCLFCNEVKEDAEGVLTHCRKEHGFDIGQMQRKHGNVNL